MQIQATRASVALVAAAALILTGCADKKTDNVGQSGGSTAMEAGAPSSKPLDANGLPKAEILQEAAKAIRETYSEHLVLNVDKKIQGLPVLSVDGDLISFKDTKRVAAQGRANVRIKEDFVDTKFVVVDGVLYTNLTGTKYQPIGKAGEKGVYDPAIILDMDKGLAKVVESVQDPKVEARETVDSVKTVRVTGTISPQVLDPILPQITEVASKGNAGTALPITLWIADDSSAKPQPKPNVVKMQVRLKDGNIDLSLSEFGKDVKITKPSV